jgi:hypothetical protein
MKTPSLQTFCSLASILLLVSRANTLAADSQTTPALEGIWKWTFTMPDGSQVTPKLKLKREDGQFTGTSSFRAGSETPVTNLVVNGNELSFQVVRQRDGREIVTRYAGTLSDDSIKGKMISNWTGEEQSYDWKARRVSGAEGTWKWSGNFGGFRSQSTLKLKQDKEKLTGKLTSGRGTESDIKEGKFKDGEISFEVERDRDGEKTVSRYYGKLSGDKIVGKMELNFFGEPRTNDWEAVRVD